MTAVRPVPVPPREYHFPRFERLTLSNGLRIIVAPARKLPIVTVLAVVDAPAVKESSGEEGLAELTAVALREGTKLRNGSEILEDGERLGTSIECGADWDRSILSMTLLKERLEPGFALFSDVLTAPEFPTHEVERLKAERVAERLQIIAEPRGLADEAFSRFVYSPESRYSEPLAGRTGSVTTLTTDSLRRFYSANYSPFGTTMIIVGDISTDEAVTLLSSSLDGWKAGDAVRANVNASQLRSSRGMELIAKAEAAQAEIRLGHVGIPRKNPDYFPIVVMNSVLGGLFSSRINLNLREKHGYTYGASSYFDWRRNAGPFVVSTAVQSEVVGAAIRETLTEIDRMREEAISEEELSLATSYLAGVFPIRYETTGAIASALAALEVFELPDDFYDGYRDAIRAVSTTDVLEAARKYVDVNRLQIVVVGPKETVESQMEPLPFGDLSVREPIES
ncbi:MAG TPA: pitrilysin family protein [Gemmatimonadaceae bacterium]